MANQITTEHRFTLTPERIRGLRVQPYDDGKDRPSTVTEGAHLANYYSDAYLEAIVEAEHWHERSKELAVERNNQQIEISNQQIEIRNHQVETVRLQNLCTRLEEDLCREKTEQEYKKSSFGIGMLIGGFCGILGAMAISIFLRSQT